MNCFRIYFVLSFILILSTAAKSYSQESVDFDRDVLPILSDRCFLCHGPDAGTNESGLRLDLASEAVKELPSGEGHAIVPNDPDSSAIIARVISQDSSLKMPPADSNLEVSEREITILKEWIKQGATYKKHWAFEALPQEIAVPKVQGTWPKNAIDNFVLEKLNERSLKPSKDSERWRWLRRVAFCLTGLPPTDQQIDEFANDKSSDAYEKVVDQLLESKQFGEHMSVAWLDAARYADSYGYQSDQLNTQWPYRDWVVRAINDNVPYDDFLTWQLAGDMLPNPSSDQRLATTFNRLHRMTNEGGAVSEEWRIEGVSDRVHTFGTAMLGLTLECCRCHDHKYDPITMRDYYSLSAFFNSIDENGLYDHAAKVPSPTMLLTDDAQHKLLENDRQDIEQAEKDYAKLIVEKVELLEQSKEVSLEPTITKGFVFQSGFDQPYDAATMTNFMPVTDNLVATQYPALVDVEEIGIPRIDNEASQRKALKLDGERGIAVKDLPAFERWRPFTIVTTIKLPKKSATRAVIAQESRGTDAGFNGWDLTIVDGYIESRMYRVWPGNAIGIRTKERVPEESWIQLATTYDGSSRASGLSISINGQCVPTEVLRDSIVKSATAGIDENGRFSFGQRFRSRGLVDAVVDDLRIYNRALEPDELAELATGNKNADCLKAHVITCDPDVTAAFARLTEVRKKLVADEELVFEIPIMEETAQERETHILARGQYDAPQSDKTRVTRNTFELLEPAFGDELPKNRLGLARWLTQPDHPLTARVAVNRLWANFFGSGLVDTPENLGRQGARPVNQKLLDWLARDFVNHGWDVKRTCKLIALSSTFRQDSQLNPGLLETDPKNELFARGPAYRLEAEAIRDSSLFVSGLLNKSVGGAPVSPYQAGGDLWRESNTMSPAYHQSVGKDLYRRSMYSVWKRTAPLPNMMAFDSATREVCTVKRSRTNTPLQALVLLNDTQVVEACRVCATNLMSIEDLNARILAAFKRYCSRDATESELKSLLEMYAEELNHFSENPADAADLLSVGETEFNGGQQWEVAAMTVVCLSIQNLDAANWLR